jgi:hypothetical protein
MYPLEYKLVKCCCCHVKFLLVNDWKMRSARALVILSITTSFSLHFWRSRDPNWLKVAALFGKVGRMPPAEKRFEERCAAILARF